MKRNVVMSTLFEDEFLEVENKLEEMGVSIIEERYDLLYHRYEIYVRVGIKQMFELRKFVKSHAVIFYGF